MRTYIKARKDKLYIRPNGYWWKHAVGKAADCIMGRKGYGYEAVTIPIWCI